MDYGRLRFDRDDCYCHYLVDHILSFVFFDTKSYNIHKKEKEREFYLRQEDDKTRRRVQVIHIS